MKAILMNAYGGLEMKEVVKPKIKPDEVLVKMQASSLNAGDYFSLHGNPWLIRFSLGLLKPKDHILGWDLAGVVEATGASVTKFHSGDKVYACCESTLAEYVAVPQDKLARMPEGLSFEQAAAIPAAACTALHALRDQAKVKPGQKVLINGASGGVGTFSVQVAKALGAEVTAVCSTRNVDMVRALGADRVIDYRTEDFTQGSQKYDLVLDNVGSRSFADCRKVLKPGGKHLPNTGHAGVSYVFKAYALSAMNKHHASPFMSVPTGQDLDFLSELVAAGKLKPAIDAVYPMEQASDAFRYLEQEHAQGKVVITLH